MGNQNQKQQHSAHRDALGLTESEICQAADHTELPLKFHTQTIFILSAKMTGLLQPMLVLLICSF